MRTNRGAGCLAAVVAMVLVVGVAAWLFRDDLLGRWTRTVEYTEVSPEAAASAEAKLERLRTRGDTIRLSDVELASYLQFNVAGRLPDVMQNPSVAIVGDTLRIGGSVSTDRLPNLQEIERLRPFLPDTTRIDLEGRLLTRQPGQAAVELHEVAVAGIPIPQRYYPSVLERLGRRDEPGLPPNALVVPLPDGVGSARIVNGLLVLTP